MNPNAEELVAALDRSRRWRREIRVLGPSMPAAPAVRALLAGGQQSDLAMVLNVLRTIRARETAKRR